LPGAVTLSSHSPEQCYDNAARMISVTPFCRK
jgi:hypothetical protein